MRAIPDREPGRVRVRVRIRVREEGRRLGEEVHLLRAADDEVKIAQLRESPATTAAPKARVTQSVRCTLRSYARAHPERGNAETGKRNSLAQQARKALERLKLGIRILARLDQTLDRLIMTRQRRPVPLQVIPHPDQRVEQFGADLISGEGRAIRRCADKGVHGFEDGGGRCGGSGDGLFKVADAGEDVLRVLEGVGRRDAL